MYFKSMNQPFWYCDVLFKFLQPHFILCNSLAFVPQKHAIHIEEAFTLFSGVENVRN